MSKLLNLLFSPSDTVAVYKHTAADKKPVKEFIDLAKNIHGQNQYFCINPLADAEGGRTHTNLGQIKNFMFECDSLPVDTQYELWQNVIKHMPVRSLTFSGSASIHAIMSLVEPLPPNIQLFKQVRVHLLAEIGKIEPVLARSIDNLTDAVRLSRLDGIIRPDTLQEQALMYSGGLTLPQTLGAATKPATVSQAFVDAKIATSKQLLNYLKINLPYLYTFYTSAGFWAAPSGLYPNIFKHSLWLFEATNCSLDTALDMYYAKTAPELLAAGYPEDKLSSAVVNAYNYFQCNLGDTNAITK